jgi:hypothetical protein
MQSQQIRRPLPRAVTSLSSRYPQLLWVFDAFSESFRASRAVARRFRWNDRRIVAQQDAGSGLTIRQRAGAFCIDPERPRAAMAIFINSKPRRGLFGSR